MERLKSLIPVDLRRMIGESTLESLELSCSSLLDFLRPLPPFQQVLRELLDPELALCRKSIEVALDLKQKGNVCFSKGDYAKALSFYSQALRHAPMSSDNADANLVGMLYVNRASSMHNLGLLEQCIRDCDRAIAFSPAYVKAWYRRGKAYFSLKNYEIAIRDLEVAMSMEGTLSRKSQIEEELKTVQSKVTSAIGTKISSSGSENENSASLAGLDNIILECVSTPSKGRGMTSPNDIAPASLLHSEEPLAAIVMKSCRETHCHFCFNEVPVDVLFCPSCTIPMYCSQYCQERAGGEKCARDQHCHAIQKNLSADLAKHAMDAISANHIKSAATSIGFQNIPEHGHECGGTHWPAVLPADVVLAGRVMVNSIERRRLSGKISDSTEALEFAHNYHQIPLDSKLELHIYAVVLSHCLQNYYTSEFLSTGASVSQLVLLISQVKINSMAVVHMKSLDGYEAFKKSLDLSAIDSASTCGTEQVRVGQAIYAMGSLFNHSCQPNIHAYFLSRTLFLRSTKFVPAWYPLELSYGAQVGEMGLQDRQKLLEEQYSFKCQCSSCSELNLSDIVLNAFRCLRPNCRGAVLETLHFNKLEDNLIQVSGPSFSYRLSLPVSSNEKDIREVAHMLLQKAGVICHIGPGNCLSCGSYQDLTSSIAVSNSAMVKIGRFKDSLIADESPDLLVDALHSLKHLRSVRHPFSKVVAQAEDFIAEAYIKFGDLECAMKHCKASMEILEKLYHAKHIVIGHELMKLASIQLSLGDHSNALNSINRGKAIFSLYYGSHVTKVFPYLDAIRGEAANIAS